MFKIHFTIVGEKSAQKFIDEIANAARQVEEISDIVADDKTVEMRYHGTFVDVDIFIKVMEAHLKDVFKTKKLPIEIRTDEIDDEEDDSPKKALQVDDVDAAIKAFKDADGETDEERKHSVLGDVLPGVPGYHDEDGGGDESDDDNDEDDESKAADSHELLKSVDELVGAAEFKALIHELVDMRPMVNDALAEVLIGRSYVFSIEDGHGLSTYLEMLGMALAPAAKAGKAMMTSEQTLPLVGARHGEIDELCGKISGVMNGALFSNAPKVICFDISEWIGSIDSGLFRKCLDTIVDGNSKGHIVVFRVPYVDKRMLARVCYAINDRVGVKAVSFPPLTQDELAEYARREFDRLGFKLADDAKQAFFEKIREEKSDGRFYGMRTVTKVVREMIYNALVTKSKTGDEENVVNAADAAKSLFNEFSDNRTAQEEMDALIGCEDIKRQIKEIVAQILSAKASKSKKRPCIHMRFVGSPGTGKTTFARILGKLLKEHGVLRVGEFYEHGARDLCGRYIGETSPKTMQICRDAYGSVLFLDEAYSLMVKDSDKDFGREAIDTLIAEMENHRDDFVVIMAGYTDEMEELMDLNPGLRSRMPYKIEFRNYSRSELFEIFKLIATSAFDCDEEMLAAAREYFDELSEEFITSKEFSNGRFVRNLFERTWAKAALRWQMNPSIKQALSKEDFDKAKTEKDFASGKKRAKIGFLA